MDDYVPYEIRRERERQKHDDDEVRDQAEHAAAVARARAILANLAGAGTDFFIEVLKPANAIVRLVSRKPKVVKSAVRGGPHFVIDSVLPAYRVPNGIRRPYVKESGYSVFDALVVGDGRVWKYAGARDDDNVIQHLATSMVSLHDLSVSDLARVAEHLSSLQGLA